MYLKNKSINRLKHLKYRNIYIKIDRNRMLDIVIHYSYVWNLSLGGDHILQTTVKGQKKRYNSVIVSKQERISTMTGGRRQAVAISCLLNERELTKEIMSTAPTKQTMSLVGKVRACGHCIHVDTKSVHVLDNRKNR
jgi:hypothetical protein